MPTEAKQILFLTRDGRSADLMKRKGVNALPVFAAATGRQYDEILILFRLEDPIPYLEEIDYTSRNKAEEVRRKELEAVDHHWALKLRQPGTRPVWVFG